MVSPALPLLTALGIITQAILQSKSSLFLLFILSGSSDLLVLLYFSDITTEGSWADIGMSVARFVVASLHTLLYIIVLNFSKVLSRRAKV